MERESYDMSPSFSSLFDLSFRRFITLGIVKILYILVLVLIAIGWLIGVVSGFSQGAGAGLIGLVVVSIAALIQVIFARVWLELIVVIFRIGENTSILAAKNEGGAGRESTPAP